MSKKSSKKDTKKNTVSSIDETTMMPIVDLSDDDDINYFDDDTEVDIADSVDDDKQTVDMKHSDITSDDLDAYLSDGGINTSYVYGTSPSAIDDTDNDDSDADFDTADGITGYIDSDINDDMLDSAASIFDSLDDENSSDVHTSDDDADDYDEIEMTPPFDVFESDDIDDSNSDSDNNDDALHFDDDGIDRQHSFTDNDRLIMHNIADRMEDITYDEVPDYAKVYDDMLNAALELRHETAENMYESGEAYRYANDIDMRAFMSYGSTVPFMSSKAVDDLCVKYGLGIHDAIDKKKSISSIDDYAWKRGQTRGLLLTELVPTIEKSEARKERKSNPNAADIDDAIAKKYSKGCHLRKSFAIDGGAIRRIVEDGEKWGFDTRQCWNLDAYIPVMLYPRFKWLQENAHGYDGRFNSENDYNEKVMNPIIDALELHLVFYSLADADDIIDAYCEKNHLPLLDHYLIEARAMQRIKHGYYLISKYLFGFWD